MYTSRKNDWPLSEACALVIDMCAVQLKRPKIHETTNYYTKMFWMLLLDILGAF